MQVQFNLYRSVKCLGEMVREGIMRRGEPVVAVSCRKVRVTGEISPNKFPLTLIAQHKHRPQVPMPRISTSLPSGYACTFPSSDLPRLCTLCTPHSTLRTPTIVGNYALVWHASTVERSGARRARGEMVVCASAFGGLSQRFFSSLTIEHRAHCRCVGPRLSPIFWPLRPVLTDSMFRAL
jgi:hypothetical protein